MITEDYVSFETAKLLKEKGFDEACHAFYDSGHRNILKFVQNGLWNNAGVVANNGICVAPTLQMATKWLRKVYNLEIFPYHNYDNSKWWFEIIKYPNSVAEYESGKDEEFDTHEESCEAAIKYCLENLI